MAPGCCRIMDIHMNLWFQHSLGSGPWIPECAYQGHHESQRSFKEVQSSKGTIFHPGHFAVAQNQGYHKAGRASCLGVEAECNLQVAEHHRVCRAPLCLPCSAMPWSSRPLQPFLAPVVTVTSSVPPLSTTHSLTAFSFHLSCLPDSR